MSTKEFASMIAQWILIALFAACFWGSVAVIVWKIVTLVSQFGG